jgi:HSP20 family protein
MAITRWDPFREVVALQSRMNSLFRDLNANESEDPLVAASFVPTVDIYEDAKKVVLKLEVPGIDQKDLDIRVENHTLTVKGERKFEAEEKEQNFHRIERRYGSFFRAFTLPSTVDTESVQANYTAGVLKLELAKKPEAHQRRRREASEHEQGRGARTGWSPVSDSGQRSVISEQWSLNSDQIRTQEGRLLPGFIHKLTLSA